MVRSGLGLIFALSVCHGAVADDIPPAARTIKPRANPHCAALGEGFFPVAGSDACIRISGHISAGAGFGSGGATGFAFGGQPASPFNTEVGAAGDLRFNTPAGPGRVYIDVRRDSNPAWAPNNP
jgi:hypothetical protein